MKYILILIVSLSLLSCREYADEQDVLQVKVGMTEQEVREILATEAFTKRYSSDDPTRWYYAYDNMFNEHHLVITYSKDMKVLSYRTY